MIPPALFAHCYHFEQPRTHFRYFICKVVVASDPKTTVCYEIIDSTDPSLPLQPPAKHWCTPSERVRIRATDLPPSEH